MASLGEPGEGHKTIMHPRFFTLAALLLGLPPAVHAQQQPNPVVWLKADAITGLKDGAAVASWADTSGMGNNAAQENADQQPTYVANAIHGKPAVHFDAANQTFLSLKRPVQDDFTIFCVFRSKLDRGMDPAWWGSTALLACDLPDVYNEYGMALNGEGQVLAGVGDPDKRLISGTGYNDGQAHIVTFQRLRRTRETALFVDGALAAHQTDTTTESMTAPAHLRLGVNRDDAIYFTGDIAEVAIFDVALTPAQRQTAERNLEAKYGIAPGGASEGPTPPIPAAQRTQVLIPSPDPKPAIHGPSVVGASSNRPFLFRVPATGQDPLTYAATGLPSGLTLDPQTGIITGAIVAPGTYTAQVTVSNAQGMATRALSLICGDHKLAQTPPMAWNSWNIYANTVTDAQVRASADALVKDGLAAHGYQYIVIDDSWEGGRDAKGNILPNRRFPDMKALADYVHSKGLKLGIYSASTEQTCSGFAGSLGHEAQDAATYAGWGMDYLKYEWCPQGIIQDNGNAGDIQAPFKTMRECLDKTDRDMVYAISTYGRANIWDWAQNIGANTWSSYGLLREDWKSATQGPFNTPWQLGHPGPGHWGDLGLLSVGRIGYGQVHVSKLTPSEQMTQLSLWSLLAAPLTLSCDLTSLDPSAFHPSTTALLTNDEVLDVDQDPQGQAATQVEKTEFRQIWARPLADGTQAVGLFNLEDRPFNIRVTWTALKLTGPQPVRDLWLHQDLGTFDTGFTTEVPAHGVALLKVGQGGPHPAR